MKFNTEKNQASVVENRKPLSDLKHETNLTDIAVTPSQEALEEVKNLLW